MTAAILATDLHKQFGDNHAVAGIDLAVEPGEIYGFLGPNGAGKSTTMKVLCTLLTPTSGSASVAGFDVVDHPGEIRVRIGVALQDSSIDGKQTGRELLKLQGRLYGLSGADIKRRMDDVIGLVDIGTAIDDRVESYSGGMKRRLDLAMSLIHRPQILFLDEPTTGLDPVSRNAVWSEVRDLNTRSGVTIFLTTQYLEEADELADRVGIIAKGTIAAEGTPAELKRTIGTDLIVAEVGGDGEQAAGRVRALRGSTVSKCADRNSRSPPRMVRRSSPTSPSRSKENGTTVRSLTLRTPTLDDVFLDVTGAHLQASHERSTDAAEEHHERATRPSGSHRRGERTSARPSVVRDARLRHRRRPGDPQRVPRAGVHDSGPHRPGVLLRRQRRCAAGLRRAVRLGRRLQGVPAPGRDHLRRDRHLAGGCARHRHPGRLLRPAAAHPDPSADAAARADGRRRGGDHPAVHPRDRAGPRVRRAVRHRRARHGRVHRLRGGVGAGIRRISRMRSR